MLTVLMTILAVLLLPLAAFAQAASQPASGPAPGAFLVWFKAWWPVIVLLGVPLLFSIINVLKKYTPKATGLITFLSILVDVFSFWGNKDSPTKASIPGLRSKPPGWSKPAKPPVAPTAALLLVPILCLSLALPSCCVFRGDCKSKAGQIATLVVDCTIEAVKTLATEMLPAVIAIITSGGKNWSEMLDLLKGAGFDALACSLQQAGQEVQNMTVRPGAVETHYLIKMKLPPNEVQARVNKYLGEAKGKDGKLYRVEFKKPAAVTP